MEVRITSDPQKILHIHAFELGRFPHPREYFVG